MINAARSNLTRGRREFIKLALRSAGLATLGSTGPAASASRLFGAELDDPAASSLSKAYMFLDQMMDLYAKGLTLRLAQSYVNTDMLNLGTLGFTYDNDVMIMALLERGLSNDLSRARVLGNSLVYAQSHDPYADGRIRDGYDTDPFILSGGTVNIDYTYGQNGTATGNMAWTGMALCQLYHKTGASSYLNAAKSIASWVQTNTYDTRGSGGYTAGLDSGYTAQLYKSTEHNIDLYAFFTMLASLTGNSQWATDAQWALGFVESMWDSTDGHFWTGTGADGVTTNYYPVPEDCQSWSYLALKNSTYAGSIDWAYANLAATDGSFSGVSFSNADTTGVWFEGTTHMAAAFRARNRSGDLTKAKAFLQTVQLAQTTALNNDGLGIDAASKDGLQTGFGYDYYAALHVGATGWYCIADQGGNPLLLK